MVPVSRLKKKRKKNDDTKIVESLRSRFLVGKLEAGTYELLDMSPKIVCQCVLKA